MKFRIMVITFLFLIVVAPMGSAAQSTLPPWRKDLPDGRAQSTIVVGDTPVVVDLAISPQEQQLGLGYRNGLNEDQGMLFVGTSEEMKTFWMKGMRFCLDIIWVTDGEIVGAAESVCPDPEGTSDNDRLRFSSDVPVTHVLEMDAGWLKAHGYGPGTTVDMSGIPGVAD